MINFALVLKLTHILKIFIDSKLLIKLLLSKSFWKKINATRIAEDLI